MENTNQQQISKTTILDYVRSAKMKGVVDVDDYGFTWDLEGVFFRFNVYENQTDVDYFGDTHDDEPIGKFIKDNAEVLPFIEEINDENKMVAITKYFLGLCTSFEVVDKSTPKKQSDMFVRHYYSC